MATKLVINPTTGKLDVVQDSAGGSSLWEVSGSNTQLITADDVDFQNLKAIAMACDNGATLPSSGVVDGQWFKHTPTGRSILYMYDSTDTEWKPIASLRAALVYVDSSGTDSQDSGGASGASAYATVQYAIDQAPGKLMGEYRILLNGETFTENLVIRGKKLDGAYDFILDGTLTEDVSDTMASAVQGTGATQGSITDLGGFGSFDNQLIYSSSLDEYRIIDSDTNDIATIGVVWSGLPTGNYKVYDWATTIDGTIKTFGQKGLIIRGISVTGRCTIDVDSEVLFKRSRALNRVQVDRASFCTFEETLVNTSNAVSINCIGGAFVRLENSKLLGISSPLWGLRVGAGSGADVSWGNIIDAYDAGIDSISAAVRMNNLASLGYLRLVNCTVGGQSTDGGIVVWANGARSSTVTTGTTTAWNPAASTAPNHIGT